MELLQCCKDFRGFLPRPFLVVLGVFLDDSMGSEGHAVRASTYHTTPPVTNVSTSTRRIFMSIRHLRVFWVDNQSVKYLLMADAYAQVNDLP